MMLSETFRNFGKEISIGQMRMPATQVADCLLWVTRIQQQQQSSSNVLLIHRFFLPMNNIELSSSFAMPQEGKYMPFSIRADNFLIPEPPLYVRKGYFYILLLACIKKIPFFSSNFRNQHNHQHPSLPPNTITLLKFWLRDNNHSWKHYPQH